MYIRTKKFKNKDGSTRTYLQIVEGVRVGNKVRQKVICNLGRLEQLKEGELDNLIEKLAQFSEKTWVQSQAKQFGAKWAKEWGTVIVFQRLWEQLGLSRILKTLLESTQITSSLEQAIFAMVVNRLCEPRSKRGVYRWLRGIYHPPFKGLSLHHLYRGLDFLADNKDAIEVRLFDSVKDLFNLKLDLFFWDTTSTYFEGSGPEDIAQYGFSKDKRPDRVQIIIGILMTKEGIPVAHQIFPGNTHDTTTFRAALKDIRTKFNIDRVILVADRGMVSEDILREIEKAGLKYIVGVPMRKAKAMKEVLSKRGRYRKVKDNLKVKEISTEKERYIICLNPEQAQRDRHAREEIIEKIQNKLKTEGIKSFVANRGYRKYLKIDGANITVDREALKEEEKYDGKYVLRTNTSLEAEQIALAYKDLWKVERAFREMKSGLDLRPIYHWSDKRVRGHVMVCFLAFLMETIFRKKLAEAGYTGEYEYLIDDLRQLKAVEIQLDGHKYLSRTELQGDSYTAFKALGIRPPEYIQKMP